MPDTLHTVWSTGELLGIHCLGCDHRAVLGRAELPTIRRANMMRLRDLKLCCGLCHVRGQAPEEFKLHVPPDQDAADRFIRGHNEWAAVV
jgi:hypothetical protein